MTWLVIAFVAPLLWAAVALIDVRFVQGIYADPLDGAVVSGLFQCLPWLMLPFGLVTFSFPGLPPAASALTAGALFLLSFHAYFRALFVANDGALMQLLWNLSVLAVPFAAWLILGEQLMPAHYAGIGLAFAGLCVLAAVPRGDLRRGLAIGQPMLMAVLWLSLSMVAARHGYALAANSPDGDPFWSLFLLFCAGAGIAALALLAWQGDRHAHARRIAGLARRHAGVFILAETLSLIATVASQRAISLAPAVSLVAVIESLVPVFVMLASLALLPWLRRRANPGLVAAYQAQLDHPGRKSLALALIAGGIYVIA